MADSPRWCEKCQQYGDHHTDKHPIPEPFDPMCQQYAKDMDYLDEYLDDGETRADYIRNEEGTYNPTNGHFLCDVCYIKAGMPASPTGWKCP